MDDTLQQLSLLTNKGDFVGAEAAFHEYLSGPYLKQFGSAEFINSATLYTLLHQYLKVAIQADRQIEQEHQQLPERVENAARLLTRYFNAAVNDRSATLARKTTVLLIFGALFPAYVHLGNWRLAGNVIRVLDNTSNFGDLEINGASKSDRVRYGYWRGRYALSQGDALQADVHFQNAFRPCHREHHQALASIYSFWSLVRLYIHKQAPKKASIYSYNQQTRVIGQIMETIRVGDILGFRRVMQEHQEMLLKNHLYYFLAAKMSHLVVRQICRRVWLALNGDSRLHLSSLVTGCSLISSEQKDHSAEQIIGEEEVECLLANAINEGLIKGYISHERKVLVLSKKNPFPGNHFQK